jgi:hypothetical protein
VSFAALILVGEYPVGDRPAMLMKLAGQTLLERLVRQVKAVGVNHIVVLSAALPAEIVGIIDRLRQEGLALDLARDAVDAADRIHPDEKLIVIDGPLIVAQSCFSALLAREGPAVMTIKDCPPGQNFERIDAQDYWLGIALLDGTHLRATSTRLGDWVLGSTMLRQAVQIGAERIAFTPSPGDFPGLRAENSADARHAAAALINPVTFADEGWLARIWTPRCIRWCVQRVAQFGISYQLLEYSAIILIVLSLLSIALNRINAGLALFVGASLPLILVTGLKAIVVPGGTLSQSIRTYYDRAFLIWPFALAFAAASGPARWALIALAGWLNIQWVLKVILRARSGVSGGLVTDSGALTLILLAGAMTGQVWAGLILVIALLSLEQVMIMLHPGFGNS